MSGARKNSQMLLLFVTVFILESSRLLFFKMFFANSFAFSEAKDNTSCSLNRDDIAGLPFQWTQCIDIVENTICALILSKALPSSFDIF